MQAMDFKIKCYYKLLDQQNATADQKAEKYDLINLHFHLQYRKENTTF